MIEHITAAFHSSLVDLAEAMFRESRFRELTFDRPKLETYAAGVIKDKASIALGAFEDGELVGFCTGVLGKVLPFSSSIVGMQHYLYLDPAYRGSGRRTAQTLVESFIFFARSRGAVDVVFSTGTGYKPDKVGQLFELCGLMKVGGIYCLGA